MLNLMKTLVAPRAISGREKAISDKLLTIVAPITDKCYNDPMGNLIAVKYGTAPEADRKKIMLCAHMDEIGFLVTYIEDSGFIRVLGLSLPTRYIHSASNVALYEDYEQTRDLVTAMLRDWKLD